MGLVDEAWQAVLRHEMAGRPGSFLDSLRRDWRWDQVAFDRLSGAMRVCCRVVEADDRFERWLAEGFWYLSWWPRQWTGHEGWVADRSVIAVGTQILDELAFWFFTGQPVAGGIGD